MAESAPSPLPDVRLLRSITLRNILSFGPDTPPLELRALNVLIGPNASGKSNFFDIIELLKKAPDAANLRTELKADHWLWKGKPSTNSASVIADCITFIADISHALNLDEAHESLGGWYIMEHIESTNTLFEEDAPPRLEFESTYKTIRVNSQGELIDIARSEFNYESSCLFQLRSPRIYSALSTLSSKYRAIRLYREWTFGRNSTPRLPRRTDERNDFLAEDGSNLGLVLNKLRTYPEVKDQFISALNDLYEGIKDFDVLVEGNTAQIFLREGNTSIPATRLSDGTLREVVELGWTV